MTQILLDDINTNQPQELNDAAARQNVIELRRKIQRQAVQILADRDIDISSPYATTSTASTSYVQFADWCAAFKTSGGLVMCNFIIDAYNATVNQRSYMGLYVDGVLKDEVTDYGSTGGERSMRLASTHWFQLSEGPHTFQLMWKTSGGTLTLDTNVSVRAHGQIIEFLV